MSATTVIVISIIITILVLWASIWVIIKGYAYKHTIDTDDDVSEQNKSNTIDAKQSNNDKA